MPQQRIPPQLQGPAASQGRPAALGRLHRTLPPRPLPVRRGRGPETLPQAPIPRHRVFPPLGTDCRDKGPRYYRPSHARQPARPKPPRSKRSRAGRHRLPRPGRRRQGHVLSRRGGLSLPRNVPAVRPRRYPGLRPPLRSATPRPCAAGARGTGPAPAGHTGETAAPGVQRAATRTTRAGMPCGRRAPPPRAGAARGMPGRVVHPALLAPAPPPARPPGRPVGCRSRPSHAQRPIAACALAGPFRANRAAPRAPHSRPGPARPSDSGRLAGLPRARPPPRSPARPRRPRRGGRPAAWPRRRRRPGTARGKAPCAVTVTAPPLPPPPRRSRAHAPPGESDGPRVQWTGRGRARMQMTHPLPVARSWRRVTRGAAPGAA